MDKRYQVFLSSTFLDLHEERQKVIETLLDNECIPSGMELFPAAPEMMWELIERRIQECDFVLLVIAGKYGSVDGTGVSYTEREYRYALEIGKPVLAFVHSAPDDLPAALREKETDKSERLQKLVNELKDRACRRWKTAEELQRGVATSLRESIKRKPAGGWVHSNYAVEDARKIVSSLLEFASRLTACAYKLKTRCFCHTFNQSSRELVPYASYTAGQYDDDRLIRIPCDGSKPESDWYIIANAFLHRRFVVSDVDWQNAPLEKDSVKAICKHIRSVIAHPIVPLDGTAGPIGTISCDSSKSELESGWVDDDVRNELRDVFATLADAAYQLLKNRV